MTQTDSNGRTDAPLDHLTVLDFSQVAAAPFAATLLADYGADVITIEPPGGASQRQVEGHLPNVMRNRRSICIDLKHDRSQDIIERLIEDADILIENNRPGVSKRLGFDYGTVSQLNEGLIYCSLTGFGQEGPYSDRPAIDPIAQAMSGLMSITGEPDRKPSRVGASVVDFGTSMSAAYAIMVALWHRERTGKGQFIDSALLDTAAGVFMNKWITLYSKTERTPERMGNSTSSYAPSGIYDTKDEMIYISIPFDKLWSRFAQAIDRPDLADDDRFATRDARNENRDELDGVIESAFLDYAHDELVDRLNDAGVPAAKVQDVPEVVEDEHLRERGTIVDMEDVDGSPVKAGGNPAHLSEVSPRYERPPEAGEHTDTVLEEFGFSPDEIGKFRDENIVN